MPTQSYRPTLLAGQCYLRVAGSSDPLRPVGNVSLLDLDITEEVKDLTDYTQTGGGTWASVSRVKAIEATMKLHDLDGQNLALATYGTDTDVIAGTVTTEAVTAMQGGLIRTEHPNPTAMVLTNATPAWVTGTAYAVGAQVRKTTTNGHIYECKTAGTSGGSEPTWKTDGTDTTDGSTLVWADLGTYAAVAGTDYEVRPEGLFILEGGIPDGAALTLAYSYGAYSVVEAMVASQQVYEVSFGGLNEAMNGTPVILDLWRVQFGAASKISQIGDDFASLEIKGKVLKDTSKGSGKSAYFREQIVS